MASEIKDRTPGSGSRKPAEAASGSMVWFNGAVTSESEARVSPFDHGLLVGDGVFETLAAHGGRIFAMTRHYERLRKSAEVFGIEVPARDTLERAGEEVLVANALERARVRITVTGGLAPLGSEKGKAAPTVVVAAAELPNWGASAEVVVVPFTRNETGALTGLKTTSYGENVVALAYAKERGASEAIFGNTRGNLCEGTGSNIFLVRDEVAITPPLSSGCLAGITRSLVLELCEQEGIALQEEDVSLGELESVEEAFLTSTTRDVQAIGGIGGRELARVPGEVTSRLRDAFTRLVARDFDP